MPDDELITITLTDRAPVRIKGAQWPVIATASGDSFEGNDYARHQQALNQNECDTYLLEVRQHEDGRTLVYGEFKAATAWTRNHSRRGGELLPHESDLVSAIRRVGEDCILPDRITRDCIADLPPVDLDATVDA